LIDKAAHLPGGFFFAHAHPLLLLRISTFRIFLEVTL
jgi:hypothetical protein